MPPEQQPQQAHRPGRALYAGALTVVAILVGVAFWSWYSGIVSFSMPQKTSAASSAGPNDLDSAIQGLQEISDTGHTSVPMMIEQNGSVRTSVVALKQGVYFLSGRNSGSATPIYTGTVEITLRDSTANIYDLTWKIEGQQQQRGVGILQGGVLSVGYYETTASDTIKDIGTVGYIVIDDSHLEGEWTSVQGGDFGIEELSLQLTR